MFAVFFGAFAVILAIYSVWIACKGESTPDYLGWLIAAVYQIFEVLIVLAVFGFIALVVIKVISP